VLHIGIARGGRGPKKECMEKIFTNVLLWNKEKYSLHEVLCRPTSYVIVTILTTRRPLCRRISKNSLSN